MYDDIQIQTLTCFCYVLPREVNTVARKSAHANEFIVASIVLPQRVTVQKIAVDPTLNFYSVDI